MPLLIKNIQTPEQLTNYIEGCLNDFETGIATKDETSFHFHQLINTVARACADKTSIAKAREVLDLEEDERNDIRDQVIGGG